MSRWIHLLLILLFPTLFMCSDSNKLNVLLISGLNNHQWQQTTPFLQTMLEESGRFQVFVTDNPENLNPAELNQYDVIVSN